MNIRIIAREDLGQIPLRCLPDGGSIETLFVEQGTVGTAAWEGVKCVGTCWFYVIEGPEFYNRMAPSWSGWTKTDRIPRVIKGKSEYAGGRFLGLNCIHVGRTTDNYKSMAGDSAYHKKGIGTKLVVAATEYAKHLDLDGVFAPCGTDEIESFNNWAGGLPQRAYLRMGFTPIDSQTIKKGVDIPPFVSEEMEEKTIETTTTGLMFKTSV